MKVYDQREYNFMSCTCESYDGFIFMSLFVIDCDTEGKKNCTKTRVIHFSQKENHSLTSAQLVTVRVARTEDDRREHPEDKSDIINAGRERCHLDRQESGFQRRVQGCQGRHRDDLQ
ncbi:hypothetical protein RRG08_003833 [Elysia crispata]|uniref:Uncharacterized protein n=1 Tax=Elysia crispata TaxID=231223 RepID=A0AAE0ZER0_9GAST|nr:hypothetical protein RRG08_003833 [Elysia crispata]